MASFRQILANAVKQWGKCMRVAKLAILAIPLSLCGCAANSGVVPMGGGSFMVSRQAATGFSGTGNLKASAVKDASAYCAAHGQDFEVTSATQNEGPFILGKYPRAEVNFRCIASR